MSPEASHSHTSFSQSRCAILLPIYNMDSPSKWAAYYKDYFVYLSCRDSAHFPSISEVEAIIGRLGQIHTRKSNEVIRPRAVHFDDKHKQFYIFADYLVPKDTKPSLSPRDFERILHDWQGLHSNGFAMWYLTGWDIRLTRTNLWSDHYKLIIPTTTMRI